MQKLSREMLTLHTFQESFKSKSLFFSQFHKQVTTFVKSNLPSTTCLSVSSDICGFDPSCFKLTFLNDLKMWWVFFLFVTWTRAQEPEPLDSDCFVAGRLLICRFEQYLYSYCRQVKVLVIFLV